MKTNKFVLSALCAVMFAFAFSACDGNAELTDKTMVDNSNRAVTTSTEMPTESKTPVVSETETADTNSEKKSDEVTPADDSESESIKGELQLGKTDSVILYVGMETGDYAAYCFTNDSEAGKKILASCKDKEQCEIKATIDGEVRCKVPGLEADLSASGRILKVASAKTLGRRK